MAKLKRVAILGGGIAGLSTAWHLSDPKNPKSKNLDITVYQQGWLLGGKCASVKNRRKNHRIEEHGVHLFGGGYFNALKMMRDCYEELASSGLRKKSHPLGTFDKAFHRHDFSGMWWVKDIGDISVQHLQLAAQTPNDRCIDNYKDMPTAFDWINELVGARLEDIISRLAKLVEVTEGKEVADAFIQGFGGLEHKQATTTKPAVMIKILEGYYFKLKALHSLLKKKMAKAEKALKDAPLTEAQRMEILQKQQMAYGLSVFIEFLFILCRGFIDDLLKKKADFDSLDGIDYISWLKGHKASKDLLASPIIIAHPNILFAYTDGDTSEMPKMAAGVFLYWTLRMSAYMGGYIWRFAEGTGETVVTPLYKVLKNRGVKFEFFHTVRDVAVSPDAQAIDHIKFDVQARVKKGREFNPLETHKGKGGKKIEFWPEAPDYSMLKGLMTGKTLLKPTGLIWNPSGGQEIRWITKPFTVVRILMRSLWQCQRQHYPMHVVHSSKPNRNGAPWMRRSKPLALRQFSSGSRNPSPS